MKKILSIMLFLSMTLSLHAFPVLVTVNGGDEKIPIIIVNAQETRKKHSIYNPAHFKDKGKYAVMMSAETPYENWEMANFYIKPAKNGKIELTLQAGWHKHTPGWVVVKSIEIFEIKDGKKGKQILQNPEFTIEEGGFVAGWTNHKHAYLVKDENFNGLALSYDNKVSQDCNVSADVELMIVVKAITIF